jgi:hypothetical protein
LARVGLKHLGDVTWRYTNLDAKYDQIIWEKFDTQKARKEEKIIDKSLWLENLHKISINELNSSQSFFKEVNTDKLWDKNYMNWLLVQMEEGTINWKTSVLSGLIRWVEQHYGIIFSAEEFMDAFVNNAEKVNKDDVLILSNLWRDRNQKFQWKINWDLFKININWTDIYFKDKCTNIVTVVNDFVTTIDTTSSIPLVIATKTWIDNIYKWNDGGTPPGGANWNPNSTPDVETWVTWNLWNANVWNVPNL